MSNKKYRTLDGLYKALVPVTNNYCGMCKMKKNEEDIAIFFNDYPDEPICGTDIVKLLPVLKRANWIVRRNTYEKRIEILTWVSNDNK